LDLVKEQKRDEKFDIKLDVLFEDDAFTPIDELPFTLPRLPPWIPRNKDDPILASDEQLTTFLDTSPLAQSFECSKCRQLFGAKKLFDHFYQYGKCVKRPLGGVSFMGSGRFWEEASGADVETPPVRIDKEVLSVSLALHQAIEDTPLELDYESIDELPDLHMEFELPVSRWYAAGFACDCPNYEARFGLRGPPATVSQIVSLSLFRPLPFEEHRLIALTLCSTNIGRFSIKPFRLSLELESGRSSATPKSISKNTRHCKGFE
jgi:hypothetical protein